MASTVFFRARTQRVAVKRRIGLWIVWFAFETSLRDHKGKDLHVFLLPANRQLEAVGKERLHHLAGLISRSVFRHRGLKIVVVRSAGRRVAPVWKAHDLRERS